MEGEVVISSSKDQSIFIWEPSSLTVLATFTDNCSSSKQSLAFTENMLISSQSNKTILHYYTFGKENPDKKSGVLEEMTALASYANYLLAGSVTGNLYIWDLNSGSLIVTWPGHMRKVMLLSFDDFIVSAADDASLKVFRTSSVLQGNIEVFKDLSLNMLPVTGLIRRGRMLYTCSNDKSLTIFSNWEVKTQKFFHCELTAIELSESLNEIFIAGNTGQVICYVSGVVWDIDSKPITNLCLTLTEKQLLVSTNKIYLISTKSGEKIKTFSMHLGEVASMICIPRPADFDSGALAHKSTKPMKKTVEGEPGVINFSFVRNREEVVSEAPKEIDRGEESQKLKTMNSILYRLWVEHCI